MLGQGLLKYLQQDDGRPQSLGSVFWFSAASERTRYPSRRAMTSTLTELPISAYRCGRRIFVGNLKVFGDSEGLRLVNRKPPPNLSTPPLRSHHTHHNHKAVCTSYILTHLPRAAKSMGPFTLQKPPRIAHSLHVGWGQRALEPGRPSSNGEGDEKRPSWSRYIAVHCGSSISEW